MKLFEEIELRLIASLKRNLERHRDWEKKEGFRWPAWQAVKLRGIERFRRENMAVMAEYRPIIEAQTQALMQEQFAEGAAQAAEELETLGKIPAVHPDGNSDGNPDGNPNGNPDGNPDGNPGGNSGGNPGGNPGNNPEQREPEPLEKIPEHRAGAPPEGSFFGVNEERLEAFIGEIQKSERAAQTATLRTMDDEYRKTILKAETALSVGAVTLPQALDIAVKDFLARGVTGITYSNGRRVNIASYAEMALRTAATRSFLLGEAKRRAEYGVDTVLVSQYNACSKTCLPWQGRVYIDDVWGVFAGENDGKRGKSENGRWYPLLSVAVKGGLFHPNCRHTLMTWVEGESTMPPPQDEERTLENAKLEARQRALEREVRRWKRLAEGALDAVAAAGYKRRVKQAQDELRAHIARNQAVLHRSLWREQTYGVPLEKQPSGAILKAGVFAPIPVTNAAIQRVPLVKPRGFTPEQAKTLRKHHREVLRLAQGDKPNTEYAALLDENLNVMKTVRGENGAVRVKGLETARYFVHNHPSGLTFSLNDIEVFLENPELLGISAVGNNGTVHYFGKTERFDAAGFARDYALRCAQQPDFKSTPEAYIRFMETLLEGGERYGFEYHRGRK